MNGGPPYSSGIAGNGHDLYARAPAERLDAARALSSRAIAKLTQRVKGWPLDSPGALNAWLLLVTNKPPTWRDPLLEWKEQPLTLGQPHEGFFYPDPLGFWSEVRRWSVEMLRMFQPAWDVSEALALTALVHVGKDPRALSTAMSTCRPRAVVFLDEPAWSSAAWEIDVQQVSVPDPHRPNQAYQGFWGKRADGVIVGKSPQHPTMHRFYRQADMAIFLRTIEECAD